MPTIIILKSNLQNQNALDTFLKLCNRADIQSVCLLLNGVNILKDPFAYKMLSNLKCDIHCCSMALEQNQIDSKTLEKPFILSGFMTIAVQICKADKVIEF